MIITAEQEEQLAREGYVVNVVEKGKYSIFKVSILEAMKLYEMKLRKEIATEREYRQVFG